jgi:hypothetical protein
LDQFVANSAQSPITLVAPRIESLLLCGEPHGATGFAQVTTVEELASGGELIHLRKT